MTQCRPLSIILSVSALALYAAAGGVAPAVGAGPPLAGAAGNPAGNRRQERPWNILFFLADDIADPEASCYDARYVSTPHIDALAKTGVKFETCFATPLCQPSRVEMLTGRYAFRTGFYHNWGAPRAPLVPKNVIFAQLLQQAGYKTFVAGKWHHMGVPATYGFDESCITWGMDDKRWITDGSKYPGDPAWQGYYASYWWPRVVINDHHYLATGPEDYGPDICAQRTIDFMARNRQRPFAAFFFTTLEHHPWLPTPDNYKPGMDRKKEDFANFKPGVEYTDKLVGRLVAAVEKLGLRERTIIFYAGDNGPAQSIGPHGKPVDGGKGHAVEEGCRVPMIVNCPGVVRNIGSCGELVDFTDLFPTLVELAGGTLPVGYVLDGRSFAPLLLGRPFLGREWVYSPLGDKRILRDKHWLYEGDARYFYCNGHRNGEGYREVTDSRQSDAVGTRERFERVLDTLPTPGKQGAPDMDRADYKIWEQWILERVPSYSIVAYRDMKRPPQWFVEKHPQWFPDHPTKTSPLSK
jgi:arylsulfatase A